MKKCLKCNVDVNSVRKTCPLCGQILKNGIVKEYRPLYPPFHEEQKKINVLLRILLFISIVSILVTVFLNITISSGDFWSFYVILGVLYGWILFRTTIMSRQNIANQLLTQLVTISIVAFGIDRLSGYTRWSLNYVIPFSCIATTIAILMIIWIKSMKFSDYIQYFLIAIIISWAPFVLYLTKVVTEFWPSISAAGVSVIAILGMIIFADTATKDELKKRFHI